MKIIILAAGSSTRLSNETQNVPKGLLKINGRSIIEIQLELFQKNQLSDITIITGWLPIFLTTVLIAAFLINKIPYQNQCTWFSFFDQF